MADVSESLEYRFTTKGLRKVRRDMKKLSGDVEELGDEALRAGENLVLAMEAGEDSIEDLQGAVDGFDTKRMRVALQRVSDKFESIEDQIDRLDGRTIDIRTDVDEDRVGRGRSSGFGGGARLPGELDEVQEGFEFFSALPPKVKALAAAAGAAAATLGAAGGLAGVATQLAVELGPQGLKRDVQATGATLKAAGRDFAVEFEGVIRDFVLPAGRRFSQIVRNSAEDLAAFSRRVFEIGRSLEEDESFGARFIKKGPLGLLQDVTGDIPGVPNRSLTGAVASLFRPAGDERQSRIDSLVQGVGDLTGLREIVSTMTDDIDRVRDRFQRGLIPKRQLLSQMKSLRLGAFEQLQKLEQKFPKAFPQALLDSFAQKLKGVQGRLEALQRVQLPDVSVPSIERATPATAGGDVSGPQPAQGGTFRPGSTSVGSLQAQARMLERVRKQLTAGLSTTQQAGVRMVSRIGAGLGDVLGRMATLQTRVQSLGDVFVSVGRAIVQSLQRVVSQLISAVTQAAILKGIMSLFNIGSLGSLGGSFGSIFSSLLSLDSGGFVKRDTLAMVHAGEVVAPLDQVPNLMGGGVPPLDESFSATWDISLDRLRLELERNQSFRNA